MPFFIYGHDAVTGEATRRLFSEASSEADARAHGESHGMVVSRVIACREDDRPGAPAPVVRRRSAAHDSPSLVAQQRAQFWHMLEGLTPVAYISYTLIGVNCVVFTLMVLGGANLVQPDIGSLLAWGADFGPLTLGGQWWRVFSSVFVHIGLVHLAFNMIAFAYAGQIVERMIGNLSFLLVYLVAGLGGSLLALYSNAMVVEAGASGAIFGVYGALLALVLMQGRSMPSQVGESLGKLGVFFLLYNVINSFRPGISLAAHMGGLLTGFVCGLIVALPLRADAQGARPLRQAIVSLLGVVLFFAGMSALTARYEGIVAVQKLLSQFDALDYKAIDAVATSGLGRVRVRGMKDPEYMVYIARDVLPQWQRTRAALDTLSPVPRRLQADVEMISTYMRLSEEGWALLSEGLREHDTDKSDEAKEKLRVAGQLRWGIRRAARTSIPADG